jgi:four helix bundle protein
VEDIRQEPGVEEERKIKTFEDLEVWQFCRDLRRELTTLAKTLPVEEKSRLADQIIRASRSVTNNIAEGYGRYHIKENMQFCRHSRGSAYELLDHLGICAEEGYITSTNFDRLRDRCMRGIKLINGYIRFLNKMNGQLK